MELSIIYIATYRKALTIDQYGVASLLRVKFNIRGFILKLFWSASKMQPAFDKRDLVKQSLSTILERLIILPSIHLILPWINLF